MNKKIKGAGKKSSGPRRSMDMNRLCKIYTCAIQCDSLDKYRCTGGSKYVDFNNVNTAGVQKSDGRWI